MGLATGAALWVASCSPAPPADPVPAPPSDQDGAGAVAVRVMTYNIHHANPPSRPGFIDIGAVVTTIRAQKPDLVALQEVDVRTGRSGEVNQAEEIAGQLGMHYFFGKAIDYDGGAYGVAILSAYPLQEAEVHQLPTRGGTGGEPRILAVARVQVAEGIAFRFGSTHLDAQSAPTNRQLQVAEIVRIASSASGPFLLAGDFNATPDTEAISTLDRHFKRTCQPCAPTIPANNPNRAIDYIAFSPLFGKFSVVSHQVIPETYASDHRPVVSVLQIRP